MPRMVGKMRILIGCFPLAFLGACGSSGNDAPKCITGASVACACPTGQQGAQICTSAGAFGACVCAPPEVDGGAGNPNAKCIVGASVACACPNRQQGAQVCTSEATFSVCACAAPVVVDAGGLDGAGSSDSGTTNSPDAPVVDTGAETQQDAASAGLPPFKLAVLGKPGKWGANPNGDPDTAFQDWLNSSSVGATRVDNFTARATLTSDFLNNYNVIILASLSDDSNVGPWWTYSDAEVAAFQAWVQNGGGVIALTGYSSGDEMAPDNQLIGFSGITYNSDGVWGSCSDQSICSCTGSQTLSDWIRTDPVIANLSVGVTLIGYANGHPINAPADGHVAATMDGNNALVGKLVGKGRVLAYGNSWITYTSQWTGAGDPSATDPSCRGELPQDKYQTAQFWYNMITWVQPR